MLFSRNCRILVKFNKSLKNHLYQYSDWSNLPVFNPKNILILTKLSRYDFEKQKHHQLNEIELRQALTARGSDYHMLRHRHNMHKVSCRDYVSFYKVYFGIIL